MSHNINLKLGIVMYNPRWDPQGGRHWALAVNTLQNRLSGRVSIYQAINRDDIWSTNHLEGQLTQEEYYHGVIDLGTFKGSEDIVLGIIESFGALGNDYDCHGRQWSCAWWAIRSLRAVQAVYPGKIALLEDDLDLYTRVTVIKAAEMFEAEAPLHLVKLNL